nr:M48 family metallopeptidase [Tessaracoccus coleopterorum]
MTIGIDKPKIVVNSALVDLLDDQELRFVLGHELGHALSGHALYRTLLQYILTFGFTLTSVPFGGIGLIALRSALTEWSRKSELSADRAGLLATQDVPAAVRVNMKLASGGHLEDLDQTEFLAQAREYQESDDLRDSIAKLMLVDGSTHPMNVVRASEIRRWVESGAYAAILAVGTRAATRTPMRRSRRRRAPPPTPTPQISGRARTRWPSWPATWGGRDRPREVGLRKGPRALKLRGAGRPAPVGAGSPQSPGRTAPSARRSRPSRSSRPA